MKKNIIKIEAKEFFTDNDRVFLKDYDDPLSIIDELYSDGADAVWVVDEYNNGLDHPDTIWIKLGDKISKNLLITIVNLKPDECGVASDQKSIRLWWD